MKNLYSLFFFLIFPFILFAQNIHGIWSGSLVNDSMHRTQNFELGLSEYRGKITGFTYTTFIENDTFYYSIKRIKAERIDGFLVVEDVEMVGNNFPARKSKKVKQTTRFPLINDSTFDISRGSWTTNQTKKYYAIGGSARVLEQEDEKESDLLAHLQEMNVKTDLAVNTKEKKKDEALVKNILPASKTEKTSSPLNKSPQNNSITPEKKDVVIVKSSQPPEIKNIQKTEPAKPVIIETKKEPVLVKNNPQQNVPINSNKNDALVKIPPPQNKSPQKEPVQQPIVEKKEIPIVAKKAEEQKIIPVAAISTPITQKKESIEPAKELPANVASRKTGTSQEIYFKNDSLILALYDNGIVDGDTVSVFLNGENIILKQRLKEAATKKTIYITPGMPDSLQLVFFADNLGSIPPNTGLLTIRDGDDVYQVRFSADLQKNASVMLRRRR